MFRFSAKCVNMGQNVCRISVHCLQMTNGVITGTMNMLLRILSSNNSQTELRNNQVIQSSICMLLQYIIPGFSCVRVMSNSVLRDISCFSKMPYICATDTGTVKPVYNDHLYNEINLSVIYSVMCFNED